MSEKHNIERTLGDTFPVKLKIMSDGGLVNLEGWNIYLVYKETQQDTTVKKIRLTGIVKDIVKGQASFFPRIKYCEDITDENNILAYEGFQTPGVFKYNVFREKDVYYRDDNGLYVIVDNMYVLYDSQDLTHVGLQRYVKYTEVQNHYHGNISIIDHLSGS